MDLQLTSACRPWLLNELDDSCQVLLDQLGELVGQVDEMVRAQVAAPVVLTVAHDVISSQVLLIEEDDHPVVGVADDGTAEAEGHILPLRRVDVDDSVTDLIVVRGLVRVGLRPEGEALLVNEVGR